MMAYLQVVMFLGFLYCKASMQNITDKHNLAVTENVSVPNISFTVVKESSGNFTAHITCASVRGTPPITFTLQNNSQEIAVKTTKHLNATFTVPIYLDQQMGTLICQAQNGYIPVIQTSLPMQLEAVRVGGASVVTYEQNMDENFQVTGLQLCCQVERGTFPRYIWFHNNIPLMMMGHSHAMSSDNSTIFLALNPSMFGDFHCQAFNSFDMHLSISSEKRLISKEASNQLSVMVVTVVFGCFSFMMMVLTGCCFYGVYKWRCNHGLKESKLHE